MAPTWGDRLAAWWEGYDLDALRDRQRRAPRPAHTHPEALAPASPHTPAPPGDAAALAVSAMLGSVAADHQRRTGLAGWTQERAEGAQFLWGDGRIGPTMDDGVLEAAHGLDLGRGSDILDAAAGLGGMARALNAATDARIVGLEPDPVLALLAANRAAAEGLGARAPVFTYDPDHFIAPGRFDLVVSDGILRRTAEPSRMIGELARAVRPGGRLVLSDFAQGARLTPRDLRRWAQAEQEPPRLQRVDEIARAVKSSGLKLIAVQDITAMLQDRIARTLRALLDRLRATARDALPLRGLSREFEVWGAHYAALGQGAVSFRIAAVRPS